MNTMELLEAVKARRGITSDYALAKVLGITQQAVSSYRSGRSRISDDVALTVAEILGMHPFAVIAQANAERANTAEQKAKWNSVLEKISASFTDLLPRWNGQERRASHRGQGQMFMQ